MPYKKGEDATQIISVRSRALLRKLKKFHGRTMRGHLEFLIDKDAKELGIK